MRTLSLIALAAAVNTLPAQSTQTVAFQSQDIAVFNFVGEMRVVGSNGTRAEAVITRRGREGDRLTVELGTVRGRESLRVLYPANRIRSPDGRRGSRSTVWVDDDGTWGDGNRAQRRRIEISGEDNAMDAAADIELRVPKGGSTRVFLLAGTVDVRNVNGQLQVDVASANITSTNTQGRLSLDTGSGDVLVRAAEGDVLLDTGSGTVRVEDASGGKLFADTGSGEVFLSRVAFGSVTLDTGSGEVSASFRAAPSNMLVDSGSGRVTLTLPRDSNFDVEVETGSGDIQSDFPIRVTRKTRRSLVGVIGSGGGRLAVDSGSGDVRLLIAR